MDKQSLLELLANNQLEDLFKAMKNQQGHYSDLVLLESQWNDLRAKQRNGIISNEQAGLESARIRKSLLDLIDVTSENRNSSPKSVQKVPNRTLLLVVAACVGLFIVYQVYTLVAPSNSGTAIPAGTLKPSATHTAPGNNPAQPKQLNISEATPITLSPGNFQYERVYSVVKTAVESTGGGKSLITITVGLNFKGIINTILSTEKFRLVADELPGPLAPTNFLSTLIDSKSYAEGDIKFEISDHITRFSIILEGKEDKKWNFSR